MRLSRDASVKERLALEYNKVFAQEIVFKTCYQGFPDRDHKGSVL
jgi:hypothetical protein